MASSPTAIIIRDEEEEEEEELDLGQGRSRPQRAPRRDYSYPRWGDTMDDATDVTTSPARKRRRKTMDGESIASILEDACKKVQKTFERNVQKLEEKLCDSHHKYEKVRRELRQEQETHQTTKEELSKAAQRRFFECPVCYEQPDHWVTLLCGHLFCQTCNDTWENPGKTCPTCREPIKGHVECKPYAG